MGQSLHVAVIETTPDEHYLRAFLRLGADEHFPDGLKLEIGSILIRVAAERPDILTAWHEVMVDAATHVLAANGASIRAVGIGVEKN